MAPRSRLNKWLDITEPSSGTDRCGFSVHVYNKLDRIVAELDPHNQEPSIIAMWGGRRKDEALETLLGRRAPPPRVEHQRPNFELTLHPNTNRPMIFVDCHEPPTRKRQPFANPDTTPRGWGVHLVRSVSVPYPSDGRELSAFDVVGTRLLMAIADVVCVFLRDFDDLQNLEERLATWIAQGPATTLPVSVRPHLLLVTNRNTHADVAENLVFRLSTLQRKTSLDVFSEMTVVNVDEHPALGTIARHRPLKEQVWYLSHEAQIARWRTSTLFSARHLVAFFHRLVGHLASGNAEPFDFIRASRLHNRVPDDLSNVLEDFLRDFHSPVTVNRLIPPVLASNFLYDHYLPEMHVFEPEVVFKTLYASACRVAFERTVTSRGDASRSPKDLFEDTERLFSDFFTAWRDQHLDLDEQRRQHFSRLKGHFRSVYRSESCFGCLCRRKPEHLLSCGHRLCHSCVPVFGHPTRTDPHRYRVGSCPLCKAGTGADEIGLRPQYAGLRVISFDGGGCGAIIALTFFDVLERYLKIPGVGQRLGDLYVGSSAGALDSAGMIHKGWSNPQCLARFEPTARKIFTRRALHLPRNPLDLRHTIISCLQDTIYDAAAVDAALHEQYGDDLIDDASSFAARHGIKSAMTVTTVPDTKRRLITNYNGFGTRRRDCDYRPLLNPDRRRGLSLWQSVRCTSAAPIYFPPHELDGTGMKFKDGGTFLSSNPTSVALAECRAIMSARRDRPYEDYLPDYILALGAGFVDTGNDDTLTPTQVVAQGWESVRQACQESGLGQLCGYVNSTLCGETAGRAFQTANPTVVNQGRYHRFDVLWPPALPKLDNVAAIPHMRAVAEYCFTHSPELETFALEAPSRMFYLDCIESCFDPDKGCYVVTGRIRCTWRHTDPHYNEFYDQVINPRGTAILTQDLVVAPCTFDDHDNLDHPVTIELQDLTTPVAIRWRTGTGMPKHISGSPFNMQEIYEVRYFEYAFGRPTAGRGRLCARKSILASDAGC